MFRAVCFLWYPTELLTIAVLAASILYRIVPDSTMIPTTSNMMARPDIVYLRFFGLMILSQYTPGLSFRYGMVVSLYGTVLSTFIAIFSDLMSAGAGTGFDATTVSPAL